MEHLGLLTPAQRVQFYRAVGEKLPVRADGTPWTPRDEHQVRCAVELLEQGNTVPYITRYRKDMTGGMDEHDVRALQRELEAFCALEHRRAVIQAALAKQAVCDDAVLQRVAQASTLVALEDAYVPYKRASTTKAARARALADGRIEKLAEAMWSGRVRSKGEVAREAAACVVHGDKQAGTVRGVLEAARWVIAELFAEDATVRAEARRLVAKQARLVSTRKRVVKLAAGVDADKFSAYFAWERVARLVKPHEMLAVERGAKQGVLSVKVVFSHKARDRLVHKVLQTRGTRVHHVRTAALDGWTRLLLPALSREVRAELKRTAHAKAEWVFGENVRALLRMPPMRGKRVLGIDPGFRSGCKLAAVDEHGVFLGRDLLHIHTPAKRTEAAHVLRRAVAAHRIDVIAIGNGTASFEVQQLVDECSDLDVPFCVVSECGASVYSTSAAAAAEFPQLSAVDRGSISIARRLQDPLAELVKVPPRALGVGMYQHDVRAAALDASLATVVQQCVSLAGVDVNSASAELLAHVSGLSRSRAAAVFAHRQAHGPFTCRKDLLAVAGIGKRSYEQCAGFLRVHGGTQPLDQCLIHPAAYPLAHAILAQGDMDVRVVGQPSLAATLLARVDTSKLPLSEEAGEHTVRDIIAALQCPSGEEAGHVGATRVLRVSLPRQADVRVGSRLCGTVTNVVDYCVFVDVGLKDDVLLHRSHFVPPLAHSAHPLTRFTYGERVEVVVVRVQASRTARAQAPRIGVAMLGAETRAAAHGQGARVDTAAPPRKSSKKRKRQQ